MGKSSETKKPAFFSRAGIQSTILIISCVFAFRWSVASPYVVPTPSMEPSIKVGDRVLGNHLAYGIQIPFTQIKLVEWGSPQRGDIVIFKSQTGEDINLVKRVIAIGGDEVRFEDGVLFINGVEQPQTDANTDRSIMADMTDHPDYKRLYRENLAGKEHWVIHNNTFAERRRVWPGEGTAFRVPEGEVFVSGDNRDNSGDSRMWGTVPINDIYGRATRVLWSAYVPDGAKLPDVRLDRFGMELE